MAKTTRAQASHREHRPIDVLKRPQLPLATKTSGLPESWTVIFTEAENWPYVDPDENGLANPELSFNDFTSDPEYLPEIEPFSEDEPWGKMISESDREYELFSEYRALGITRSRKKVADKMKLSKIRIDRLAKDRNWEARVQAWDTYRERVYTAELILGVKEMAHDHARIASEGVRALSTVFESIVETMEDEAERDAFLNELKTYPVKTRLAIAQGSARVIPSLMNAERLSRGLPTEISADLQFNETRVTVQTSDDLADILIGLVGPLSVAQSEPIEAEVIEDEPRGDSGT